MKNNVNDTERSILSIFIIFEFHILVLRIGLFLLLNTYYVRLGENWFIFFSVIN